MEPSVRHLTNFQIINMQTFVLRSSSHSLNCEIMNIKSTTAFQESFYNNKKSFLFCLRTHQLSSNFPQKIYKNPQFQFMISNWNVHLTRNLTFSVNWFELVSYVKLKCGECLKMFFMRSSQVSLNSNTLRHNLLFGIF